MEYTKDNAIEVAKKFIEEVNELEKKYGMSFNSDTGDIYLSFKTKESGKYWDHVNLGWVEDEKGIKVIKDEEWIRENALNKLTIEERVALGLT